MCELETKKNFNAIDGETLMDMNLPRTKFVIQGILPRDLLLSQVLRRLANPG